jgi:hypothetical protein
MKAQLAPIEAMVCSLRKGSFRLCETPTKLIFFSFGKIGKKLKNDIGGFQSLEFEKNKIPDF